MGNNDSSCKQCRRLGEKLFTKGDRCNTSKCAMVKRNYPPGFHGPKGRKRLSGYGLQLQEKQKAKRFYGLTEKQFHLTFVKAGNKTGDAGQNFLTALEMRLDNVVFRLGFADSRPQARQLVNHGHFTVDGKKASIPSFVVKAGNVIEVKENKRKNNFFKKVSERIEKAERPSWLDINVSEMKAKVLHEPKESDLPKNFNVQMIIEYYSK